MTACQIGAGMVIYRSPFMLFRRLYGVGRRQSWGPFGPELCRRGYLLPFGMVLLVLWYFGQIFDIIGSFALTYRIKLSIVN